MKLVLDNIVFKLQRTGGISTYWGELITRLIRDGVDVDFLDYNNSNIVRNTLQIPGQNILQNKNANKLLERFLPVKLKDSNKNFIFHSSYNRSTRNEHALSVITVHDFIHERFYSGPRKFIHSYQKRIALNSADRIIVISNNTKNDLLNFFPHIKEERISVIYNGVSEDFFKIEGNSVNREKPYLMFIGSREKYKNFEFAVELLHNLKDFNFLIVGQSLRKDEIKVLNIKLNKRWKLISGVDNAKLNVLYNNAYALLYPSAYEGFGIPLLESMKAGTPFLALNSSSIPEVAGNAGILLDNLDLSDFRNAVELVEKNRDDLVIKGFEQANKFSWEKCYQETLDNYKKLF